MFRRTLTIFLAVAFLVFALILGYAALGLSGPAATVEQAAAALAGRQPTRAIELLDLAEGSLGPRDDPALRATILELRQRAYRDVGNLRRALLDLGRLAALRPDDGTIPRQQIPLLIRVGDAATARELAVRALADEPEDPRLLELKGEAEQSLYRARIRDLVVELGTVLDALNAEHALAGLRVWLYGESGDPVAERGLERFENVMRAVSPATLASGALTAELHQIRTLIQESQRSFRVALEQEGDPVGAYVGLSYALREASRGDDVHWLGELYLQRFDHRFTTLAAGNLAELHLAADRHDAVLELRERYLPYGAWQERVEANRLDSEIQRLLLAEMRVHYGRGDAAAMQRLAAEADAMDAHPVLDLQPSISWIRGMHAMAERRYREIGSAFNDFDRALAALPRSDDVIAKRLAALDQRIRFARENNWSESFFEWAYRIVKDLEQDATDSLVELSRRLIAGDDPESALFEIRNARRLAEYDEDVLHVRAEAIRAQRDKAGTGVDFQLQRCRRLDETTPRDGVPDELLLPIAEAALEQEDYDIAIGCADAAADAFPWARWPRRILTRAAVAKGDRELALNAASALLTFHPHDLEALQTAWEAREALGLPTAELVSDLLVAGAQDPGVARTLLQMASARNDSEFVGHLSRAILAQHADDARCLLQVAEVQAEAGALTAARDTLKQALDLAPDIDQRTFRAAFNGWFLANAALDLDPAQLKMILSQCLALNRDDFDALLRIAARLEELGRADQAYLTLLPVLQDSRHQDARSGEHFLFGARLSLAIGSLERAEEHYSAAMSFDGGEPAAVELALLLLSEGRIPEAREVFWQHPVEDATTAALAALFDREKDALRWADRRHAEAPFDVTALALRALLGRPAGQPQDLLDFVAAHRDRLLPALAFTFRDGFHVAAQRETRALVAASGDDVHARVLLGHALISANATQAAIEVLEQVLADSPLMITARDAAIRALETAGIDLATSDDPRLQRLLQSDLATPRMLQVKSQRLVAGMIEVLRASPQALDQLVEPWISNPSTQQVSLSLVDLLLQFGRVDLALRLCEAIEPYVDADERQQFLARYLGMVSISDDESLVKRAVTKARNVMEHEAAYGIVVHFLLDRDASLNEGRIPDPRAEPERTAEWEEMLRAHLDLVRAGGDRYVPMIEKTVYRTDELRGRAAAMEVIDAMLGVDATMLRLWSLRARWLVEAGRPQEALEGLRWLYHYVPSHPRILEVIEMAAREGRVGETDVRMVDEVLDPDVVSSPLGRFVSGLLAFRSADYDAAIRLLEGAAPRDDGAHLYFLGLARLVRGDVDGARKAIDAVRTDYPDSRLANHAEHFRAELSRL